NPLPAEVCRRRCMVLAPETALAYAPEPTIVITSVESSRRSRNVATTRHKKRFCFRALSCLFVAKAFFEIATIHHVVLEPIFAPGTAPKQRRFVQKSLFGSAAPKLVTPVATTIYDVACR